MIATINISEGCYIVNSLAGVAKYDVETVTRCISYWTIEATAQGFLAWGPLKYRPNAKKTHSGVSLVEVFHKAYFWNDDKPRGSKTEAEEHALMLAIELEAKGFDIKLGFPKTEPNHYRRSGHSWLKDAPPDLLIKRFEPTISMITPRRP